MDLEQYLIGTWELVDYKFSEAGNPEPLGPNPKGFLMYTTDGFVSAQMMKQGRPSYQSGNLYLGSTEEMAEAAAGYLAYAGHFSITGFDKETNTFSLEHHMDVSMNPTWLGETQKRFATYKDGLLNIHADVNDAQLIWKKVQ